MKKDNLLNQRFGRWTVIAPAESRNGRIYWLCRCDCGREKEVLESNLKQGLSRSCGCIAPGRRSKLLGARFGKLTVIAYDGEWKCKCDCGNIIGAKSSKLLCGDITSCGCDCVRETPHQLNRICQSCGVTFLGGPRAFYCPSCRAERQKIQAAQARERARKGITRKIGQEYPCEICGELYVLNCGTQRFCKKCSSKHFREAEKELAKSRYEKSKNEMNVKRNNRRKSARTDNLNKLNTEK